MFVNGNIDEFHQITDTDGNILNVSDGGILNVDGIYYWYGQALRPYPALPDGKGGQVTTTGVVMYSSPDLTSWTYRGVILPCSTDPESELYAPLRFERPKILYNETTKKYVLWCHYVKYPGTHSMEPGAAEAGCAVCDTVDGTYTWLGTSRPIGQDGAVEDFTVFKDDDGKAYFIYDRWEKPNENCIHVVLMTDDYTGFTDTYKRIDSADRREAPAVVKHNGCYYIITSGLTGWAYNRAMYHRTKSLLDEWEPMDDPCVGDTEGSTFRLQGTYIFKKGDTAVWMAERHNTENFLYCTYVWLPVTFHDDGTISIEYLTEWDL